MNQIGNNNTKNRDNTRNKYGRLKHAHVPRVLQNNMPSFFEVYSPEGDAVFTIAANDIIHLPNDYQQRFAKGHNQHNNHRLIFCPHFHKHLPLSAENETSSNDPDEAPSSCPFGEECSHVHAYLGNAKINSDIHINFAYKNLQEVKYDRYDFHSAAPLRVAPPNATSPFEDLPAHLCIRTSAYIARDRIPSHCAHYYFNRICNRGSRCFFVHAVSLQMNNNGEIDTNQTTGTRENNEHEDGKNNGDEFHVDPFYRRLYGRTETLRRSDSPSKTACEGEQQQARVQSFAASPGINISIPLSEQQLKPRCQSFAAFALPRSYAVIIRSAIHNNKNHNTNNNNDNNDNHHHHHHHHHHRQNCKYATGQEQQQPPLCQASLAEYDKPMMKDLLEVKKPDDATAEFNCNASVSSVSVSSCSTPVPDETELANTCFAPGDADNTNSNNNSNDTNDDKIDELPHPHRTPMTSTAHAAVFSAKFPKVPSMTPNSPSMDCPGCKKFVHNPYSWTETTVCLVYESAVVCVDNIELK